MSESAARAERRDLRRAMGPHVQAFARDTTQAIQTLQAGLNTEIAAREDFERWVRFQLKTHTHEYIHLGERLIRLRHEFQSRSRWERLRGFLIGR